MLKRSCSAEECTVHVSDVRPKERIKTHLSVPEQDVYVIEGEKAVAWIATHLLV